MLAVAGRCNNPKPESSNYIHKSGTENLATHFDYCFRPAALSFYELDRIATSGMSELEVKCPMQGHFVLKDTKAINFYYYWSIVLHM